MAPPPCKYSAGVAAEEDNAMVCEKVAKTTQIGHNTLENLATSHLCRQLPVGGGALQLDLGR